MYTPFISAMARFMSSSFEKRTNPYPRDVLLWESITTLALFTDGYRDANAFWRV